MPLRPFAIVALVLCLLAGGRASADAPEPPLTPLCGAEADEDTFCVPAEDFARWVAADDLVLLHREPTAQGVGGSQKLVLRARTEDEDVVFQAKWKHVPPGLQRFNNVPRKELAAQAVARLVLPPGRHAVPPTELVCLPKGRGLHGRIRGLDCSLGVLSLWLHNVAQGDFWDAAAWAEDGDYRRAIADFNLATYLIDHRDSREANFLMSADPDRPRMLTVDNGLAFSGFRNTLAFFRFVRFPFEADYRDVQVPGFAVEHIDALQGITRADLDRLAVVRQYEVRDGDLVRVLPTAPLRPARGAAYRDGVIQLGLTTAEIDRLEKRIKTLIARLESGELETFQ